MPLPHAVARFNQRYTDRFIRPLMARSARSAVIHHVGRKTGIRYRASVRLFGPRDRPLVVLTYGERTDWFQNLLAGPGTVEVAGHTRDIRAISLVDRDVVEDDLPAVVRCGLSVLGIEQCCQLRLGPGPFGPMSPLTTERLD